TYSFGTVAFDLAQQTTNSTRSMRIQFRSFAAIGLLPPASFQWAQAAAPPAAPSGLIGAKGYLNITGTAITDLTGNPKFPASPDVAYYYPYFEWNADPGGDINTPANNGYADNYG